MRECRTYGSVLGARETLVPTATSPVHRSSILSSPCNANVQLAEGECEIEEIVADKCYHAAETIERAEDLNFRTYTPERKRPHRSRWTAS
jgi:hypothetical protein